MEKVKILKGAAPFFYPGNEVGCLMVHGFTGTPFEVRWLGEHLNQQGYTVYGPRLAGHGVTPEDLARVHWREWYADVLAGYELLRRSCDNVFVCGLSMGGALTLLLSSREDVDGLVAMSTPFEFTDPPFNRYKFLLPFLPLLGRFVKTLTKGYDEEETAAFDAMIAAEQTRRGEELTGHPSYKAWIVPAAAQFMTMLREVQEGAPLISAPALLIHSKADKTVSFNNLQRIYDALGSTEKEMVVLEDSGHVICEYKEAPIVFEAVATFIAANL